MPTALIKKLAAEGKGSIKELENKWEDAKSAAESENQGSNYAYITTIFKRMINASSKVKTKIDSNFMVNAASRILSSGIIAEIGTAVSRSVKVRPSGSTATELVYNNIQDPIVSRVIGVIEELGFRVAYLSDGQFRGIRKSDGTSIHIDAGTENTLTISVRRNK